eukprot:2047586-Alexandrium_andersonii.AAC.1
MAGLRGRSPAIPKVCPWQAPPRAPNMMMALGGGRGSGSMHVLEGTDGTLAKHCLTDNKPGTS